MQVNQCQELVKFKRLDFRSIATPARSSLYQLEPCAIGTEYTESLTSYTKRLAEAHAVTVSQLVRRKLALAGSTNLQTEALHWLGKRSAALNGTATTALDLIQVLQETTMMKDLHLLTMLLWKNVFSSTGLPKTMQAWCPLCFQEWKHNGQTIYEPLLWTIKVVTICPVHHCPLQTHCPNCQKNNYPLDYHSRLGYCSRCKSWLGETPNQSSGLLVSRQISNWDLWVLDNIGHLIKNAVCLTVPLPREHVKDAISAFAAQRASGNVNAFSRLLDMGQPTVQSWHSGRILPKLEAVLQVCQQLDVKLFNFLMLDAQTILGDSNSFSSQEFIHRDRKTFKSPRLNQKRAKKIIDFALQESPPPTIKAVMQRVGCTYATLYKHFDVECRAIVQRRASHITSERIRIVRQALTDVIEANENPPPSLLSISKRVKIPPTVFYQYASDLCNTISKRYLVFCQERAIRNKEKTCETVRRLILKLHSEGIYPSSSHIMAELNDRHIFRQEEVQATWYKTLQELGLKG